ncbi:MAG: glycosyltransferase family 4 protein [Rhodobacteraceae bacterium]|jgi:glycosyltransferase involved in cell wall biosynthesis|nr:glycosyltransferase family 4 protein [Paracoccaceae bacterium]
MSALLELRPFTDAILGSVRQPARVGLLTDHNPHDRTAFSGTAHHMMRALADRRDIALTVLGGHRPVRPGDRLLRRLLGRQQASVGHVDTAGLDVVVGLTATRLLDRIAGSTGVPYIHVTDAVPSFLRDVYGWDVPADADELEGRVIARSSLTVYSSRYMARRAAQDFPASAAGRTAVVPFGVNLDSLPDRLPRKPGLDHLRLLWVGTSWDRKGGPLALAALDALRDMGVPATLVLAGDVPRACRNHPGVTVTGYLDKNRSRDRAQLSRLFAEAHLFILPTRADCTPMVVAEANAHGTPALVTDVGGVSTLIEEGRNGAMLDPSAGPREWARAIRALTRDPDAFAARCRASFDHAHGRLSWATWARDLATLIHGSLARAAA